MNTYNIFDESEPTCILFHAIARDVEQVYKLAIENNININGLSIELERKNVKDQMGKPFTPSIEEALIH